MALATACAVAATAVSAHADEAPQAPSAREAEAQALFDDARQLQSAGKIVEACRQFAASQRIDPGAGTLLHLADCYEQSGRLSTALATFKAASAEARRSGRLEWISIADQRVTILEPRVPKVIVTLPPGAPLASVTTLDDRALERDSLGLPVALDPGEHKVSVTARGFVPFEQRFVLGAGELRPVLVTLAPAEPAHDGPASSSPALPSSSGLSVWPGVAVAGAGAAGIGLGAYFGFLALSKNSQAAEACPQSSSCPDTRGPSLTEDARNARTASVVAFSVGGAFALGGAVLIGLSVARRDRPSVVTPTAAIGPDGWRIGASASF